MKETQYYACAIPGNSTDAEAVRLDSVGSKQSVTASGSPPPSFVVCQSQLAGMKQTGQLHALHQLIGLTDSVTFQSTYAS